MSGGGVSDYSHVSLSKTESSPKLTIGVTGTINVCVMSVLSLVLDVLNTFSTPSEGPRRDEGTYSSGDGDSSSLLLGSLVNLTVIHKLSTSLFGQVLRDGCCQGCFSMIDVL